MKLLQADGYEVVERVGQGTYARVDLIRRLSDDRLFAAKTYTSEHGLKSADGEIRALQMLESPFIVKLYKVYRAPDEISIVLSTGMGGSLRRRIKIAQEQKQPFSETAIRMVMVQLFAALMETHGKGLIHRDVNPLNILFLNTDSNRLFLIDFGIAEDASEQLKGSVGTANYMAPEVQKGREQHTPAADIYGVGAILFEMKHLRLPKPGEDSGDGIINRLLCPNPADRPPARKLMQLPICGQVVQELVREQAAPITYTMWLSRPAEDVPEPLRSSADAAPDPLEFMSEKHTLPGPKRPEAAPAPRRKELTHMSLDPETMKADFK